MPSGQYKDYFKSLNLDRSATSYQIKAAFRNLARKYHPDLNPNDLEAEEKFKEINEAYEVLSDPTKRKKYEQYGKYWENSSDQFRSNYVNGEFDFSRYGNFDEFIKDLLGSFDVKSNMSGFSNNINFADKVKLEKISLDAEVNIKISLREAFDGTDRNLSINNEKVKVHLPAGIKNGTKLRLKGKGNRQPGTGKIGDLYLKIIISPHQIWELNGDQLSAELPVSFSELVVGTIIIITIMDETIEINIPPGTEPGKKLRLKGKGWPMTNRRGDLILKLVIHTPEEWSSKELSLFQELEHAKCHDPRKSWLEAACL
tara:strand:- start:972 stop:1913 length:942 start_codon:yes stop_codon:yes gene_type:complete